MSLLLQHRLSCGGHQLSPVARVDLGLARCPPQRASPLPSPLCCPVSGRRSVLLSPREDPCVVTELVSATLWVPRGKKRASEFPRCSGAEG